MASFMEIEENYPKIHIEAKGLRQPKPQGSKKGVARGITVAAFKLHYGAMVTKTTWNWHQTDI